MKKKTKKIISIVGILVLIILAGYFIEKYGKPGAVAYTTSSDFEKDSSDLIYKTWQTTIKEGTCSYFRCNKVIWPYSGGVCDKTFGYTKEDYPIKVYLDNNGDLKLKLLNSTTPLSLGTYWSYYEGFCPGFLDRNYQLLIPPDYTIDKCYNFGTVDPNTFNNLEEIKCEGYCEPNKKVCVVRSIDGISESQICSSDGTRISHSICVSSCQNGECIGESYSFNPVSIDITRLEDGFYGTDFTVPLKVYFNNIPYNGATISGILYSNGLKVSESAGYSNNNGEASLLFKKVTNEGNLNLVVSTKIKGIYRNTSTFVYFNALPPIILSLEPQKSKGVNHHFYRALFF